MKDIRLEFVTKAIMKEDSISELCRQYNISRPTAYKWIERYKEYGSVDDRSHAPFSRPLKTADETEKQILEVRCDHPTWGPRKILRYLTDRGSVGLPAASTVANILKRNGFVSPEASQQHVAWKRFEREKPNQLWQMDFKGHFGMLNGQRCFPLTILDDHSRFSLCVDAKENERWIPTKESLQRVFREFGLPSAILCDNGNPWADNQNGYTPFEVWMMQIDVLPIHGRALHPQTQGKDERFHRTMKEDLLLRTPIQDILHAQKEFDAFRYCYNYERPHSALNLDVPSKHYRASKKKYIENPTEPEYESGAQLRKVNYKGYVSINRHRYYLSESLIGKYLETVYETDKTVSLCYGNFLIAKINLEERLFVSRRIYRR